MLGLVLLTPVFVGDLDRQRERATQKGAELVLDARIDALTKIDLAQRIASDIKREPGRLPDINRSFAAVAASERERPQLRVLEGGSTTSSTAPRPRRSSARSCSPRGSRVSR